MALAWLVASLTLAGGGAYPAAGQSAPALTFALGPERDSYVIGGSGFEPGATIRVIELPCAELPCPSGGLAHADGIPVTTDGSFSALLRTSPSFEPLDARNYRLIVATPTGVAWNLTSPSVRVPLHHAGASPTPGPPATGAAGPDDAAEHGRWPWAALLVGAGGALAAASFVRRRQ